MQLVKQHGERDCGAACLAMVLGLNSSAEVESILGRECAIPHDDIAAKYGFDVPFIGVTDIEIERVLFEHGLAFANYRRREAWAGSWVEDAYERIYVVREEQVRAHLSAGGVAILGVPSLNNEGGEHWIVARGNDVFDPSLQRCYQRVDQVERINQAILVAAASARRSAAEAA